MKHSKYKKPIPPGVKFLDVYRVCDIFKVDDSSGAIQHALKKMLCPGQRGAKDYRQDLEEARDSIQRKIDMLIEDSTTNAEEADKPTPAFPTQLTRFAPTDVGPIFTGAPQKEQWSPDAIIVTKDVKGVQAIQHFDQVCWENIMKWRMATVSEGGWVDRPGDEVPLFAESSTLVVVAANGYARTAKSEANKVDWSRGFNVVPVDSYRLASLVIHTPLN